MVRRRSCAVSNHEATMGRHPSRRGEDAAPQDEGLRFSKAVMTVPATFVIDAPGDAARAVELRRGKLFGASGLGGAVGPFFSGETPPPGAPPLGVFLAVS